MIDARAREALDGLQRVAGRVLARMGFSPTVVTVLGVVVTAVGAHLILRGALWQAGLVLTFAGVTDFLDGAVARATGRTSVAGAFLDSVSDRVSDALVYSAIVWVHLSGGEEITAAVALAAFVGAQLTSYIRAKAESLGFDCKVGFMERAERIVLIVIGLVFSGILAVVLWVLAIGSGVTVVQRFVHVWRQARRSA